MPEGMRDTELNEGQGRGRQEADLPASSPGPWATFFSRIKEEAKLIWAIYVACILALLTVCSMMGTPILNPLRPVSLSNTSFAVGNGDTMLIVDRVRTRLLFADGESRVVGIIETGRGVVPIDEVTDITLGDDVAYVAGLTRMEDGKSIASEAVLAFGLDGTFLETIWETSYQEGEYRPTPSIVDLEPDESGVVVLRRVILGEHSRSVSFVHVGVGEQEKLLRTVTFDMPFHDVSYEHLGDRLFVISFDGKVSVLDGDAASSLLDGSELRCKAVDASGDRAIMQDASSGGLLLLEGIEGEPTVELIASVTKPRSARLSGNNLYVVLDGGSLLVENLSISDSREMSALPLATRLSLSFAKYIICMAFLILMVVVWSVRAIRDLIKGNEIGKFRRIIISIAVSVMCAVSTGMFSYSTYMDEWKVRESQLLQMGSCLGYFSTEALGESIMRETQLIDDPSLPDEWLDDDALFHAVNGLALSAHEGGIGANCRLYVVSKDGTQVHAVISSDNDIVVGERVFDEELADAVSQVASSTNALSPEGTYAAERAARSSVVFSLVSGDSALGMALSPLISPDGTCRMVAQVSCQQLTFVRAFLKNALGRLLAFALLAIGLYLVTDEGIKLAEMLMDYRRSDGQDVAGLRVRLTRPLTFLHGVALYMDYALVAVMTRSLFLATGAMPSAAMIAVPVFAASMGMTVSDWVGKPLTKRHPMRTVTLVFVVIGLFAQVICFVSIRNNWFEWYVVGKFFTSFGYGFVISALYKLVACLQEHSDDAYAGIEQAGRSSSIVAGIVGGLVALAGGLWIYPVSAVLGAVLLWGLWKTLPDDLAVDEVSEKVATAAESIDKANAEMTRANRFLRSPQMILTMLFGLIPITIAGGYKSYFLPLFLSSSSYTNTQISNYSVICNLALYLATKGLRQFRVESDGWLLTWTSLAAIGVVFGVFARNQSASWAILAAIFISILCWFAKRCRFCARAFGIVEFDLNSDQAYETVSWVDSFVVNIRSVAMGAFLSLGTTNGCLALAAYMAASAVLYAITIRPYYERMREKCESYAAVV